jgi:hypothetical protein
MKIKSLFLIGLCAATLALSGCATNCSKKLAYNNGMDDGLTPGTDLNKNYAAACMPGKQKAVNTSYYQGYQDGLKKRPAVAAQTMKLNANSRN